MPAKHLPFKILLLGKFVHENSNFQAVISCQDIVNQCCLPCTAWEGLRGLALHLGRIDATTYWARTCSQASRDNCHRSRRDLVYPLVFDGSASLRL